MQEEDYEEDFNIFTIEQNLLSYLHKITVLQDSYYISVVIKEELKENLLEKFHSFVADVTEILESMFS
ncbi:MAG: hypothetical protein ACTSP6_07905 [Promethearchaeota archaeon]|jgi:hypothetical protein